MDLNELNVVVPGADEDKITQVLENFLKKVNIIDFLLKLKFFFV